VGSGTLAVADSDHDHDHHDVPSLGTLYLFQQTLDHGIAVFTILSSLRADFDFTKFTGKFGSIKSE
jgi:hypothetical protein